MELQAAMADEKEPMKVSEVTTRDLQLIEPTQTIRKAARLMAEMDASIMPVREGDRPFDMITDRDIAVCAVIEGKGPNTPVREMMTNDVKYYYEDDGRELRPGALAVRPNLVSCARSAVANRSAIHRTEHSH